MPSARSSCLGLVAFTALLFGCPAPSADATIDATLTADALVIEGTADEEQGWYASFTIEAAPPDEYAVFSSPTRPTSLAGLADLDLASCTASSCSAPGLGTFDERVKLDAVGRLKVGGWSGANTSESFFVALVVDTRRDGEPNDGEPEVDGAACSRVPLRRHRARLDALTGIDDGDRGIIRWRSARRRLLAARSEHQERRQNLPQALEALWYSTQLHSSRRFPGLEAKGDLPEPRRRLPHRRGYVLPLSLRARYSVQQAGLRPPRSDSRRLHHCNGLEPRALDVVSTALEHHQRENAW